ncbi:MAG: short-chain dehydrogenase [Rhodospirillales bacterium]|nr:short-chain dehydrogenase [Rhodospirillales bacterium]
MSPDSIRLDGRVILVAGAGGQGIGTAAAVLLAQAGATVVAIDRSEEGRATAEAALAASGGDYRVVDCNLEDCDAVRALIDDTTRELGAIRGVLNVVGGIQGGDNFARLLDLSAGEIFDRVMNANLKATFNCSTEAARAMTAQGLGGSIVQIASLTGLVSMPFGAGYGAAKAALINLTRTMAVEWGSAGIRVNALAVGLIRTARSRAVVDDVDDAARQALPLGRVGMPEEIAGAVLFLLSDLASYVTGAVLNVDGGAMARAPYNDASNLPVFVNDSVLRARLLA